jgi:hypothetical protein
MDCKRLSKRLACWSQIFCSAIVKLDSIFSKRLSGFNGWQHARGPFSSYRSSSLSFVMTSLLSVDSSTHLRAVCSSSKFCLDSVTVLVTLSKIWSRAGKSLCTKASFLLPSPVLMNKVTLYSKGFWFEGFLVSRSMQIDFELVSYSHLSGLSTQITWWSEDVP